MDGADRYRLDQIRDFVVVNLDASYVVDHLIQEEVIEPFHDEQIRAERTPRRRTEVLLDILLDGNRPRNSLKDFRQALQRNHGFIVEKLDAVEVPDHGTAPWAPPGLGGMRTAADAVQNAAAARVITDTTTNRGITRTTTTNRNTATHTHTTVSGNNNLVIIGGNKTSINYH